MSEKNQFFAIKPFMFLLKRSFVWISNSYAQIMLTLNMVDPNFKAVYTIFFATIGCFAFGNCKKGFYILCDFYFLFA